MKNVLVYVILYVLIIFTSISLTDSSKDPLRHIDRSKSVKNKKFEEIKMHYIAYASKYNIKFTRDVPIWATELNADRVVGVCSYGKTARIIDIEPSYFDKSTDTTQKTLIFHELTHCLCRRGHDYGEGKEYLDAALQRVIDELGMNKSPFFKNRPGFYPDGCPLSIMYPIVVNDSCVADHSKEYIAEMFDRCVPY